MTKKGQMLYAIYNEKGKLVINEAGKYPEVYKTRKAAEGQLDGDYFLHHGYHILVVELKPL